MSTTFVQYKFCSLCRTSCKKMKKHVHSPKHQEIVKNILSKFLRKISYAKGHLDEPVAKDVGWSDAERKIWCYFCACDVVLHLSKTTMVGDCVIVTAGFLGHMTRRDHSENTSKFLKDNLIDMKRMPEFILDNNVFLKFLEKAEKVSVGFLNEKYRVLRKTASRLRHQNELRRSIVHQGLLEQNLQRRRNVPTTSHETTYHPSKLSGFDQAESERKKTIQAFGEGVTAIDRLNEDDTEGNIHSNAIPPWMRTNEDEDDRNGVIGPSMEDWTKHKKAELKRKLPSCRVGAKFDHKTEHDAEWLPNFGGVWSHGPRTKAGKHFKKRQNSSHLINTDGGNKFTNKNETTSVSYLSADRVCQFDRVSDNPPQKKVFPHTDNETAPFYRHQGNTTYGGQSTTFHPQSTSNCDSELTCSVSDLNPSDSSYVNYNATSSYTSTMTIKPYVSKRRKMEQSSSWNTYSSNNSLQNHFNESLSSQTPKCFQPQVPNSFGNGINRTNASIPWQWNN